MGNLPPPFYILSVIVLAFGGIPKGRSKPFDIEAALLTRLLKVTMRVASVRV